MKQIMLRAVCLILALVFALSAGAEGKTVRVSVKSGEELREGVLTAGMDEDGCLVISLAGDLLPVQPILTIGRDSITFGLDETALNEVRLPGFLKQLHPVADTIGVIGGADGPTQILLTGAGEWGTVLELVPALSGYVSGEGWATDKAVLSGLIGGELTRLVQAAMETGMFAATDAGDVTIFAEMKDFIGLARAYLLRLSADPIVYQALNALKIWTALGLSEERVTTYTAQLAQSIRSFAETLPEDMGMDISVHFTRSAAGEMHLKVTFAAGDLSASLFASLVGDAYDMSFVAFSGEDIVNFVLAGTGAAFKADGFAAFGDDAYTLRAVMTDGKLEGTLEVPDEAPIFFCYEGGETKISQEIDENCAVVLTISSDSFALSMDDGKWSQNWHMYRQGNEFHYDGCRGGYGSKIDFNITLTRTETGWQWCQQVERIEDFGAFFADAIEMNDEAASIIGELHSETWLETDATLDFDDDGVNLHVNTFLSNNKTATRGEWNARIGTDADLNGHVEYLDADGNPLGSLTLEDGRLHNEYHAPEKDQTQIGFMFSTLMLIDSGNVLLNGLPIPGIMEIFPEVTRNGGEYVITHVDEKGDRGFLMHIGYRFAPGKNGNAGEAYANIESGLLKLSITAEVMETRASDATTLHFRLTEKAGAVKETLAEATVEIRGIDVPEHTVSGQK